MWFTRLLSSIVGVHNFWKFHKNPKIVIWIYFFQPKIFTLFDSIREEKQLDWRKYRLWNNSDKSAQLNTAGNFDDQIKNYLSKPDEFESDSFTLKPHAERDTLDDGLVQFLKGGKLPESWSVFNTPQKTIGEFYRNSRLHWLSTWRQEEFKMIVYRFF